jgi:transposase InsO family protein
VIQKVIEIDQRYRSSWDVRAIAHVVHISPTTVAGILREVRGPRPQRAKHPHRGRTCFIDRDVMWSSDFLNLPERQAGLPDRQAGLSSKRYLLKTLDETSRFRLGWEVLPAETAEATVRHAEDLLRRAGHAPLVWKYDHGSQFTSDAFQGFLKYHQIVPFPIPPRAPWANGRTERDNQEIQNWLIPVWDKGLSDTELERDVDEGMGMLNFIKPRMVLGYQTSAQVYFGKESMVEDADRDWLLDQLQQIKDRLWPMSGERLQRKAVRMWLQQMGFYEEWEEIPEDAVTGETVNRSPDKNVAF